MSLGPKLNKIRISRVRAANRQTVCANQHVATPMFTRTASTYDQTYTPHCLLFRKRSTEPQELVIWPSASELSQFAGQGGK